MFAQVSADTLATLIASRVLLGTDPDTGRQEFALGVPRGDAGAEVHAHIAAAAAGHPSGLTGSSDRPSSARGGGDAAHSGDAAPGFRPLRALAMSAAAAVSHGETAVLGRACSLLHFHRVTGFCSACGGATEPSPAGDKRSCTGCRAEMFPRVDPIAIAAVTVGAGDSLHVLLGRQRHFPPGMYSALAGFVEVGVTLRVAGRAHRELPVSPSHELLCTTTVNRWGRVLRKLWPGRWQKRQVWR